MSKTVCSKYAANVLYASNHDIFCVRKTIYEMLTDRKYKITHGIDQKMCMAKELSDKCGSWLDELAFDTDWEAKFNIQAEKPRPKSEMGDLVHVIFPKCIKLGKKILLTSVEAAIANKVQILIIVTIGGITKNITTTIENQKKLKVQCFSFADLKFNITKHSLAFPHRKLNVKEVDELKTVMGIDVVHLPIIRKNDAMCKYYMFVPGQIISIRVPSETSGIFPTLRIVK
jgi:DNA-directed RNA polymerase subunit H (RpoH/RPB5)